MGSRRSRRKTAQIVVPDEVAQFRSFVRIGTERFRRSGDGENDPAGAFQSRAGFRLDCLHRRKGQVLVLLVVWSARGSTRITVGALMKNTDLRRTDESDG